MDLFITTVITIYYRFYNKCTDTIGSVGLKTTRIENITSPKPKPNPKPNHKPSPKPNPNYSPKPNFNLL